MNKNKMLAIALSVFLMLSVSSSIALIPRVKAHTPPFQIPTLAYINVAPNPIGLGQSVNVGFWLNSPPPDANGPFGDRWTNITVKVTLPDKTTTNLGPFTSDDTGGTHYQFTPTEIGTYTFQMSFPGQVLAGNNVSPLISNITASFIGDYYQPSTSGIATLNVQQKPVGGIPVAPLPTNYWQTPISAMNVNNWYAIGGPYLALGGAGFGTIYNMSSNYNPYSLAPTTAHILWTKPEAFGGVLGGDYGGTTTYGNYYSTAQYERKYNPIIINGYLYYTVYPGSSTTPTANLALDLYTGKVIWSDDANNYGGGESSHSALTSAGLVTPFKAGQVLDFVAPNQYGGLAYLWTTGTPAWITNQLATSPTAAGLHITGTTLNMFDAETGRYILSVVNGTSPSLTVDKGGNLIGYYINNTAGTQMIDGPVNAATGPTRVISTVNGPSLNMWNSTQAIMAGAWGSTMSGWAWRPLQNGIIDFSLGIMWRTALPTTINGNPVPAFTWAPGGIRGINSGVILLSAFPPGGASYFQGGYGIYSGYSTDTGQQLWIQNITMDAFLENGNTGASSVGNGVWTIPSHQNGVIQGYSLNTGNLIWTTTLSPFNPYDSIGGYMTTLAGGILYLAGFGGDLWSLDMLTGKINWYTNTTQLQGSGGYDSPYGVWPIWGFSNGGIASGIWFLEEGHEYSPPLFLGARQLAVNTTDGSLVWSIHAFDVDSAPAMAYGVMTIINAYDNQIYAYGRGPSSTTVSAPQIGISTDTPITITGTVTDTSAGSKQEAVLGNYPNGLPAISDTSQSAWMESVYMQQPIPYNATGVPVVLNVIDSNNNYRQIGTTTTDSSGTFGFTWTPDIPGNYAIIATFPGTGSYYPSSAETHIYASGPAPTSSPIAVVAQQNTDAYIVGGVVATIIAIAVVGALILVSIRKRP